MKNRGSQTELNRVSCERAAVNFIPFVAGTAHTHTHIPNFIKKLNFMLKVAKTESRKYTIEQTKCTWNKRDRASSAQYDKSTIFSITWHGMILNLMNCLNLF